MDSKPMPWSELRARVEEIRDTGGRDWNEKLTALLADIDAATQAMGRQEKLYAEAVKYGRIAIEDEDKFALHGWQPYRHQGDDPCEPLLNMAEQFASEEYSNGKH